MPNAIQKNSSFPLGFAMLMSQAENNNHPAMKTRHKRIITAQFYTK